MILLYTDGWRLKRNWLEKARNYKFIFWNGEQNRFETILWMIEKRRLAILAYSYWYGDASTTNKNMMRCGDVPVCIQMKRKREREREACWIVNEGDSFSMHDRTPCLRVVTARYMRHPVRLCSLRLSAGLTLSRTQSHAFHGNEERTRSLSPAKRLLNYYAVD